MAAASRPQQYAEKKTAGVHIQERGRGTETKDSTCTIIVTLCGLVLITWSVRCYTGCSHTTAVHFNAAEAEFLHIQHTA